MYQLFIVMYISYLSVPNKRHLSKAGHNFAIAIELYHPFVTLGRLVDFLIERERSWVIVFVRGRVTNLNSFHVICYLFHLGRFGKNCCPSENIHGKYWACPKQGCFIVPLWSWTDWLPFNFLLGGNALESHICPLDFSSSGLLGDPIWGSFSLEFPTFFFFVG